MLNETGGATYIGRKGGETRTTERFPGDQPTGPTKTPLKLFRRPAGPICRRIGLRERAGGPEYVPGMRGRRG
jgi:hypothetical protein